MWWNVHSDIKRTGIPKSWSSRGEKRYDDSLLWFWLHNNEAMSDIPIICDQKLAEKFDPPIP